MSKLLIVNEAARELGVSEAWLRRAEGRVGIPKARRNINGWRVYTVEDIAALRTVLSPKVPEEGRPDMGGGQDDEGARP
ncbi:MAG: MerR family transcriptional regulator [Chloroflexi bacterium]|nr:MerR family transcriptional regulator [Chloroflexota bacterium]